jgi:hypothetical protein
MTIFAVFRFLCDILTLKDIFYLVIMAGIGRAVMAHFEEFGEIFVT